MSNCIFCNKQKIDGQILETTAYFYLAPALGSFVSDYFLIISQGHANSLGSILINEKIHNDFLVLKKKVTDYIKEKKGDYLCFEHGCNEFNKAGGCVTHCHLHILPFDKNIIKTITDEIGKPTIIENYQELNRLHNNLDTYLLVEYKENIYVWENPNIVSQFVRRVLAREKNIPNQFNWKLHPFTENLEETLKNWKDYK
jgi:diadenosine tetraphosphate (Ap4A) HIT family hydrolase